MAPTLTAVASPALTAAGEVVAGQLLAPWPAGSLVAGALGRVVSGMLQEVHRSASAVVGRSVPLEQWLAVLAGGVPKGTTGVALGEAVGRRLSDVLASVMRSPASLAMAGQPGGFPPFTGPMPTVPGFPAPRGWTEKEVIRALLRLGRVGAVEAATLPARMSVATAMSGVAVAMPGVRSTARVGGTVHAELQGRYRGRYAPPDLVLTDRSVYGGPPPGYSGRPMSAALLGGPPQLAAAYLAWMRPDFLSTLRADVTNFSRCGNWEIKPLLQAPTGVLQESWYRCTYNWVAQSFTDENPALAGLLPPLLPGDAWDVSLMRAIPVRAGGGSAYAVPFSTAALPGLVTYAVVSGPKLADIAIIIALMMQLIEREAKRQLQHALAMAKRALQALLDGLEAVAKWIAENWVVLLVIITLAGVAAVLIVMAPAWAPAVGVALATTAAARVAATAGALVLGPVGNSATGHGEEDQIPIDFGPISVIMPPSFLPKFLLALQPVFSAAADSLGSRWPVQVASRPPAENPTS